MSNTKISMSLRRLSNHFKTLGFRTVLFLNAEPCTFSWGAAVDLSAMWAFWHGAWNEVEQTYEDRLVVFADRASKEL